ncbi:DOC family protein [Aspergillus steynii IBT 23096]|uniref:DOC family protein n=1 Tax=Aspergillus steynii IBT 23096 TaxID=1392250 RepID=A0A2I2FRL2_9EURO|nr:DOC family protein [Aspergillus steynii IBT 23096]PLB43278.1 DOC family protein [Aspergillus steynii IBT 23096]
MATIWFLTRRQIERLHMKSIAPNTLPTQPNLLESAIHSPMNMKHYGQVVDVLELAAHLASRIMKNHAYLDGNKRTALVAADMFLSINGHQLQKEPFADDAHNKGLADAHVAVVTNKWTTQQLSEYYKSVATPLIELTPEIMEFKKAATEY